MKKQFTAILVAFLLVIQLNGQENKQNTATGYRFTPVVELKATPVKDQASTSTCWSFATISFIESELLRMGKGEYDLSEMWIVRNNFTDRIKDNFKKKGNGNITPGGGQPHDVMIKFAENGMVPDEVYNGLNYGSPKHNHNELNLMMKAVAGVATERREESDQYFQVVNAVLDTYLGKAPQIFTYKDVDYTPKSFAKSLGINPDDYVEVTSYSFIPFYKKGVVPVYDNWRNAECYNVPIDDLMAIMDYSLTSGYTVDWDGDNSEEFFSYRHGIAIIPELENTESYSPEDKKALGGLSKEKRAAAARSFSMLFPEKTITQSFRDKAFENKETTDDHCMHLTGITKDQAGKKYYITKNSWGPDANKYGGYLNMSESYVRAKTLLIMVNKNGIPQEIRTRLGL